MFVISIWWLHYCCRMKMKMCQKQDEVRRAHGGTCIVEWLHQSQSLALTNSGLFFSLSVSAKCWFLLGSSIIFRIHSSRLYGFQQQSTHHCLAELYTCFFPTSVGVFLFFKSAFDVANMEIILNYLLDLYVKGNLLKWIWGYLCSRTSYPFKGVCSC